MAVTRAPKKGAKAGKSKSKPAAKKSSVKKPAAKKTAPKKVAKKAALSGISGLEFYAGIPGTVGGALRMNAGCYGSQTADNLKRILVKQYWNLRMKSDH